MPLALKSARIEGRGTNTGNQMMQQGSLLYSTGTSAITHSSLLAALILLAWLPRAADARMLIYLDFNGHIDAAYPDCSMTITLPPFKGGADSRQAILRHVQEDFAPFDVTFTTSDLLPEAQLPPSISQGYDPQDPAIRVAIGGKSGDICGINRAGLATNPHSRNTVWVVESDANDVRYSDTETGNVVSHELGHAFGHLAATLAPWTWLELPSQIGHYIAKVSPTSQNPLAQDSHYLVPKGKTQIMNGPGYVRQIWWHDSNVFKSLRPGGDRSNPNDWTRAWQDDILSLTAILGSRSDDHPGLNPQHGSPMTPYPGQLPPHETRLDALGVIEMNTASWPGMCPPVPWWHACTLPPPSGDGNPRPLPNQGVLGVFPPDFFRFDISSIAFTGSTPRIYITVENLDQRVPGAYSGNLDADLEVWFNDPSTGRWTNITSLGLRTDGANDVWAEWTAASTGANPLRPGQYAVGVKSQGGYGDLGQYSVRVRGVYGLQVAGARLDVSAPRADLDPDSLIAMIDRTGTTGELIGLVAGLAESGVVVGLDVDSSESHRAPVVRSASTSAREVVAAAIRQTSPLVVVAQVIDWRTMDSTTRRDIHRRLARALDRFELSF